MPSLTPGGQDLSQNKSSLGRGAQAQPKYVSIPRSRPDSQGEEKGTCMVLGDKRVW